MSSILFVAVLLGWFVESAVEYIISPIAEHPKIVAYKKEILQYASLAAGVTLALVFGVDLFKHVIGVVFPDYVYQAHPVVGMVMTGLILGRGANYIHQFASIFIPAKESEIAKQLRAWAESRVQSVDVK